MRRLRRVPGALLLATVLVCIATREWYPFSPFPMYAAFAPTSWHVVLTDGDDRPVSPLHLFGQSAIPLRRQFERYAIGERGAADRAPEDAEARAAVALLRALLRDARPPRGAPAPPPRLRLWRVESRVAGTHVDNTRALLGEIALP